MSLLTTLFGDANKRVVGKLGETVAAINKLEASIERFSDNELKERFAAIAKKVQGGESAARHTAEVFALVRESSKRTLGMRHFDVQLTGALVLAGGGIAEMRTGEGKTLVATLALSLAATAGRGAHLVTVNDYLARRDAVWMGPVYHHLGVTVGCIQHEAAFLYDPTFVPESGQQYLRPVSRREAYAVDITYGTNNEFGFDYLRDNMVSHGARKVQRGLGYAIVDEVDSILIDEARTPLIISAPSEVPSDRYYQFATIVRTLSENDDYNVDEKMKAATLTENGITKIERSLGIANLYESGGIESVHHVESALKAHALFKLDRDYVVKDGEVVIVDEFTGRLMFGRRYSEGLHQAIEAKENVPIKQESRTLATITFQNYFRLYQLLSGMTGTALTEAEEFSKIYGLDVTAIPTHQPMVRSDSPDVVYKTESAKFNAVVADIKERHERGQPVLVGTVSIEKNERLHASLEREGIPHGVLNAKNHEREAATIAQAGRRGAVTVATNMAGRGVDIVLGGQPSNASDAEAIKQFGGLHVIGTERHEARRIDNQLRGRAGRQGDPGSSQFFLSLDDDLLRIFGSERMKTLFDRLGVPEDMPIENRLITKSIETAQRKVEAHHFDMRKHLVEYDDVINKHREVIYRRRNEILELADSAPERLRDKVLEMVENEIEQVVRFHTATDDESTWNIPEVYEAVGTMFPIDLAARLKLEEIREQAGNAPADIKARTNLIAYLSKLARSSYEGLAQRVASVAKRDHPEVDGSRVFTDVERAVLLRSIDTLWIEHLEMMDYLRQGIGLRGYGQRDPLIEYKKEAYQLFEQLIGSIQNQVVYNIFKVGRVTRLAASPMQAGRMLVSGPAKEATSRMSGVVASAPPASPGGNGAPPPPSAALASADVIPTKPRDDAGKKVGRNDPCPCGAIDPKTGQVFKYKKCGLIDAPYHRK